MTPCTYTVSKFGRLVTSKDFELTGWQQLRFQDVQLDELRLQADNLVQDVNDGRSDEEHPEPGSLRRKKKYHEHLSTQPEYGR